MKIFFTVFCSILSIQLFAQSVGVGTANPDNSAALDISNTSKGLLIPRMTMVQRVAIQNPSEGLIVYQKDGDEGFWCYDGTGWDPLVKLPRNPSHNKVLTYCDGTLIWATGGVCPVFINGIDCEGAVNSGTLSSGSQANNVSSTISYTGGNGGSYETQVIPSTGVTGLTATLNAGTLANGNGILTYNITGAPNISGTASFLLKFGGQTCTLNRTVIFGSTGFQFPTCREGVDLVNYHNASIPYGLLTDQEGNVYRTVEIGTQTWMAENLKTSTYRNGVAINPIINVVENGGSYSGMDTAWRNNTTGAYTNYNSYSVNECPFGKLYNWYAVVNSNQICPEGWRVPTKSDWNKLVKYVDGNADTTCDVSECIQSLIAGGKLRTINDFWWNFLGTPENVGATNSVGFSSAGAGFYRTQDNAYAGALRFTALWGSSELSSSLGYAFVIVGNDTGAGGAGYAKNEWGFSVRCVRD